MTLSEFLGQYATLMRAFSPWSYLLTAAGVAVGLALWDGIKHLCRRASAYVHRQDR